jgi:PAS domain S-box-containing protein
VTEHTPLNQYQQRIKQLEDQVERLQKVQRELYDAERKYRILVENANDAIFILQDGKLKYANPKALEMGGLLGHDLQEFHYTDLLHPEERQKVTERYERRLEGEKVLNVYPLRIISRNGSIFWAEVNAVRIEWDQKPATLNIIRDITSQKMIENQYLKAESLETLRTLSGGLAHSFNNLLMGVQGRVSLLRRALSSQKEHSDHLDGIENCVIEATKLTEQMLGFSQTGKYRIEAIALDKLVDGVLSSLDCSHREIHFTHSYSPEAANVKGDRHQLEQVVMNILLNSWQAIPQQGQVAIKIENHAMHEARPSVDFLPKGKWVKLTVQDNGIGMEEHVCKRVFEPFFTTKGMGRHRGLGMSSAYGIITNHNGVITIDSIPGYGTIVCVYLPAAEEE